MGVCDQEMVQKQKPGKLPGLWDVFLPALPPGQLRGIQREENLGRLLRCTELFAPDLSCSLPQTLLVFTAWIRKKLQAKGDTGSGR